MAVCSALVAELHCEAYGGEIEAVTACAACGEQLELAVSLDDLTGGALDDLAGGIARAGAPQAVGGLLVRAPTTRDLLDAARSHDPEVALRERCISTEDGAMMAEVASLEPAALAQLDEAAERAAGLAAAVVATVCTGCGATVRAPLAVDALLWEQVERDARRVLADVAELAGVFGWTEPEVLALSPARRAAYLAIARAEV